MFSMFFSMVSIFVRKEKMLTRKINSIYHFRKLAPAYLKPLIERSEISVSLRTQDRSRANELAERLNKILLSIETEYRFNIIKREEALLKLQEIGIASRNIARSKAVESIDVIKLFEKYTLEQTKLGKWCHKTQKEYAASFRLFQTYWLEAGKVDLDHKFLLSYRDLLLKLPPNIEKSPVLKCKKLMDIALLENEARLSVRQINKHLICLTSYFKWLNTHEYIPKNPAHSLLLPKFRNANDERHAYSSSEIETIIITLHKNHDELAARPERFWVPLIAMYSGMRLGEICQLQVEDITSSDGILCFDINQEGDRRLKNEASRRKTPVHPKLLELGLLPYLELLRKNNCDRLFPLLQQHSVNGYGHQLGKWFTTFNRRYITQDPKKTFHSIRHSVANELKQLKVPGEVISELLGHKVDSITMNRYGKRYRPEVLLEAIEQLPW